MAFDLESWRSGADAHLPDSATPEKAQAAIQNQPDPQQAPPPAQVSGGGFDVDAFRKSADPYLADASHKVLEKTVGRTPELAIPESPLSTIDRARFAWIKDGKLQKAFLENQFGKDAAAVVKMDEGNHGWVVREKDGTWHQVDPSGLADIPSDMLAGHFGKAAGKALGQVASFAGDTGFKAAGAMATAGVGAETGAAIGSAAGPVGAAVGGVVGAGVAGAAGSELGAFGEMGVRNVWHGLSKMYGAIAGNDLDPNSKYVTPQDFQGQTAANLMFGAAQEAGGPVLGKLMGKATDVFGAAAKRLADTPEGKKALSGLISTLTPVAKAASETFSQAPEAVMKYVPDAISDYYGKTAKGATDLLSKQKALIESVYTKLAEKRGELGSAYNEVEAKAKSATFDPLAPDDTGTNGMIDTWKKLVDDRYVDIHGNLAPDVKGMGRQLSDSDSSALQSAVTGFKKLQQMGKDTSYQDLKIFKQNLQQHLGQIDDGNLALHIKAMRDGASNAQSAGLYAHDPALAQQLGDLNAKYQPVKELLEHLEKKTDGSRIDTFLKKTVKNDGSHDANLLSAVHDVVGGSNATDAILQMEAAKAFAPAFVKPTLGGASVKLGAGGAATAILGPVGAAIGGAGAIASSSPRVGLGMGQVGSALQRGVSAVARSAQDLSAPALRVVSQTYNAMPDSMRYAVMKSPEALGKLRDLYVGSLQQKSQMEQALMQHAGSFMQQQFGNGGGGGGNGQ